MEIANHQADLLIGGKSDIAVTQAAVNSGLLTVDGPSALHIPADALDANGHVQDNAAFRAWYSEHQDEVPSPNSDQHYRPLTFEGYVNRLKQGIAQHS